MKKLGYENMYPKYKIREYIWKTFPPGIFLPITLLDILKAEYKNQPPHKQRIDRIVGSWNLDKGIDLDDQDECLIEILSKVIFRAV